ncbi:MAG: DUF4093 domain-containing protein [Lachnospiraceae bacterium]|nr:DUF4093 domain-containing protein [Lachnospiraceae bacterium]
MENKLKIEKIVLVEGKYDKIKLDFILDATVIPCDGFGIFREKEKAVLLRRLAKERGIIVLTDADGAGLVIRNHLKNLLSGNDVIHLYTPAVPGKEKRKVSPSKAGLLGVEGIDAETLRALFLPYAAGENETKKKASLTKVDFYTDGLSGGENSAALRKAFCAEAGFPPEISAGSLLEAVNLLFSEEEYRGILTKIKG